MTADGWEQRLADLGQAREGLLYPLGRNCCGAPDSTACHQRGLCWMKGVHPSSPGFTTPDPQAAVERVRALAERLDDDADAADASAADYDRAGFGATGDLHRDAASELRGYADAIRRALDGPT